MQNNCSDLEPALLRGLVSLRGAVEVPEEGRRRRGGQDGHAGDLVMLVDIEELVWIGVADLHLDTGTVQKLDNLGLDHHEIDIILPCPLGDPHKAARVIFKGELSLGLDVNHDTAHGLYLHVLLDGAGGDGDPAVQVRVLLLTS